MAKIVCCDYYGNAVSNLTQWDTNRVLKIMNWGYDVAPIIHYTNRSQTWGYKYTSTLKDGVVTFEVPNKMLQQTDTALIFIGVPRIGSNGDTDIELETVYKIELPIQRRTKPGDYSASDNSDIIDVAALKVVIETALATAQAEYDEMIEGVDDTLNEKLQDIRKEYENEVALLEAMIKDAKNEINDKYDEKSALLTSQLEAGLTNITNSLNGGSPKGIVTPDNIGEFLAESPSHSEGIYLFTNFESGDDYYNYNNYIAWYNPIVATSADRFSDPLIAYNNAIISDNSITYAKLAADLKMAAVEENRTFTHTETSGGEVDDTAMELALAYLTTSAAKPGQIAKIEDGTSGKYKVYIVQTSETSGEGWVHNTTLNTYLGFAGISPSYLPGKCINISEDKETGKITISVLATESVSNSDDKVPLSSAVYKELQNKVDKTFEHSYVDDAEEIQTETLDIVETINSLLDKNKIDKSLFRELFINPEFYNIITTTEDILKLFSLPPEDIREDYRGAIYCITYALLNVIKRVNGNVDTKADNVAELVFSSIDENGEVSGEVSASKTIVEWIKSLCLIDFDGSKLPVNNLFNYVIEILSNELANKADVSELDVKADKSELLNVVKTVKVNGESYSAVNNEVDLGEISNTSEWVDCFNGGSYTTSAQVVESKPNDWEANYKNYFKQTEIGYWAACSSAEDWEDGKIYEGLVQIMVFDNPIPIGSKVDIVIRDYEKTYNSYQSVYLLSGEKNVYVTGWDKIWSNGYYYHWANTNFDFLHPGILSSMNQTTSGRPNISIVPTQKPGAVYLNDVSIIDRILFTPQQYVLSPGMEIKVRYKKI